MSSAAGTPSRDSGSGVALPGTLGDQPRQRRTMFTFSSTTAAAPAAVSISIGSRSSSPRLSLQAHEGCAAAPPLPPPANPAAAVNGAADSYDQLTCDPSVANAHGNTRMIAAPGAGAALPPHEPHPHQLPMPQFSAPLFPEPPAWQTPATAAAASVVPISGTPAPLLLPHNSTAGRNAHLFSPSAPSFASASALLGGAGLPMAQRPCPQVPQQPSTMMTLAAPSDAVRGGDPSLADTLRGSGQTGAAHAAENSELLIGSSPIPTQQQQQLRHTYFSNCQSAPQTLSGSVGETGEGQQSSSGVVLLGADGPTQGPWMPPTSTAGRAHDAPPPPPPHAGKDMHSVEYLMGLCNDARSRTPLSGRPSGSATRGGGGPSRSTMPVPARSAVYSTVAATANADHAVSHSLPCPTAGGRPLGSGSTLSSSCAEESISFSERPLFQTSTPESAPQPKLQKQEDGAAAGGDNGAGRDRQEVFTVDDDSE